MPRLAPSLLAICAVALCSGTAWAQFKPSGRSIKSFQITTDDGSGGVQTQTYGEEERTKLNQAWLKGGTLPQMKAQAGPPRPSAAAPAPGGEATPVAVPGATAEIKNLGMTLPDGRSLPFGISGTNTSVSGGTGSNKRMDNSVDPHSALRGLTQREGNLSGQRYDPGQWSGHSFSTVNDTQNATIPWDQWSAQFASPWGRRSNEAFELRDTLDAEQREMPRIEPKPFDRSISPWSGKFAQYRNQDNRRPRDMHGQIQAKDIVSFKERMLSQNKSAQSVSMQGINRYQFRLNRPDTPGALPVATPGGGILQDSFIGDK